jgi:hypothetical protein
MQEDTREGQLLQRPEARVFAGKMQNEYDKYSTEFNRL